MELQTLLALLVVLAAAGWLGRRTWRTVRTARRTAEAGCGQGCGCESGSSGGTTITR